ncbi:MAG: hypothetical protein ACRCZ9_07345, partial [Fusobacteriaceae bacterium]
YSAIIDVNSFLLPTNFDCFNCLTNCCVQFPYEFNNRSRDIILDNLDEYDKLTQAVSILKEEGLTIQEIKESIQNDPMLIPEEHRKTTFDRCTCSCIHGNNKLCAIHKICIDNGMNLGDIIDAKPLWCSIYPLEIMCEDDDSLLYIMVPTKKNESMAMNDTDFPCMDIQKSTSPYFRRENPSGFIREEYQPFIISYYSVLKYILGDEFVKNILSLLNLKNPSEKSQYSKKI